MSESDPTAAERNKRFRQRQREQGRSEVRGIYAPIELHDRIKAYAKRISRRCA